MTVICGFHIREFILRSVLTLASKPSRWSLSTVVIIHAVGTHEAAQPRVVGIVTFGAGEGVFRIRPPTFNGAVIALHGLPRWTC